MAFNWQTFRTRALTAVVFVAVMLAGLLGNHWTFLLLFSIIHFGCWWEYFKLIEKIYATAFHIYVKLGLMLGGYGIMLRLCPDLYMLGGYSVKHNLPLVMSIAGFVLTVVGIFQRTAIIPRAFATIMLGLAYISLSWGLMMHLYGERVFDFPDQRHVFFSYFIPACIIASIWINDTMAYIVGSLIGRTPLSKVSPKKTWEGTVGGVILSIGVVALIVYLLGFEQLVPLAMVVAAIAAIAGTFGDLLESKLKRMAGVKDSGNIMPGHGGFLDRFDSLLLAVPCVWLYLALITK